MLAKITRITVAGLFPSNRAVAVSQCLFNGHSQQSGRIVWGVKIKPATDLKDDNQTDLNYQAGSDCNLYSFIC